MGIPKPEISDETRLKLSNATKNRSAEWNAENGRKISKTIKDKVSRGEWHVSLAKRLHKQYNGESFHGSWEVKYAMWLDQNGIEWIRNKQSFSYVFEGIERKYTPDFYLPAQNTYVEIKGFKTDKDVAKWEQFPAELKLLVLMEKDLVSLGVL